MQFARVGVDIQFGADLGEIGVFLETPEVRVAGDDVGVVVWVGGGEFVEGDGPVPLVYCVVRIEGAVCEAAAVRVRGGVAGAGSGGVAVDAEGEVSAEGVFEEEFVQFFGGVEAGGVELSVFGVLEAVPVFAWVGVLGVFRIRRVVRIDGGNLPGRIL